MWSILITFSGKCPFFSAYKQIISPFQSMFRGSVIAPHPSIFSGILLDSEGKSNIKVLNEEAWRNQKQQGNGARKLPIA